MITGSERSSEEGNGNPPHGFLPGTSHGQKSLEGESPRGHKQSDMTKRLIHRHTRQGYNENTSVGGSSSLLMGMVKLQRLSSVA